MDRPSQCKMLFRVNCVVIFYFLNPLVAINLPVRGNQDRSRTVWNQVLEKEPFYDDPFEIVAIEGEKGFDTWSVEFTAFDRPHKLRMQPNYHLRSPSLKIVEKSTLADRLISSARNRNCHWISEDGGISLAGFSDCNDAKQISGLVILEDSILEIEPLTNSMREAVLSTGSKSNRNPNLHMIKRSVNLPNTQHDFRKSPLLPKNLTRMEYRTSKRSSERLTLEVALFFDEAGYHKFAPFFRYDSDKISDLLLAYLNGVQALYYHKSLGEPVDIILVYMEIMKKQPNDLPTFDGERSDLLDSFCLYQKNRNKPDGVEDHWDMALYVSGLDLFAWEDGQKNSATMGLATVGGVCQPDYNCITAEFGVTNVFGRPFPSAGFTSVYILAHEIGHNLGMSHDSKGNECPENGFIMSASRGTQGETVWSSCSSNVINDIMSWAYCLADQPKRIRDEYDAMRRFKGRPGQTYTAKQQCEILLLDEDAFPSPYDGLEMICQNLPCKSPHRIGFYFAGPALEGTNCGEEKWCSGGECLDAETELPSNPGVWSKWVEEDCSSGCMIRSRGARKRHRTCTNPLTANSMGDCEGLSFDASLCDDEEICGNNRYLTPSDFATIKCRQFSELIPELDGSAAGIQALYEENRLWVSCAIFCRRKDFPVYYSPRLDLNDLGRTHDSYFPDGTFCHNDGKQNYYCLHHHCLPESFKFSKLSPGQFMDDDIPFWLGNASPEDYNGKVSVNEMLLQYLSLDGKGPLRTKLEDAKSWRTTQNDWKLDGEDLQLPRNELDEIHFH